MTNETGFWNTIQKSLLLPPAPEWDGKYQQQTHSYLSFGITHLTPLVSSRFEWNKPYISTAFRWKKYLKAKIFSVGFLSILTACRQYAFLFGFTHLLPSAFISSFPHGAAPLPAVIAIGAINKPSQETYTAEFTASSNNTRGLPTPPVKLITLTPIITADNEYSCEPNWSHWGARNGIVAELGKQGGTVSGKSFCIQVGMTRIKYCLLRNVCINWRESKKSSAKALRSPDPVC